MVNAVLGLDIGGANLKAVHSSGAAHLQAFELWKNPDGLPDELRELLRGFPGYEQLAVTMTGELCDCFATKRQGVQTILDAVNAVAGQTPVWVWRTDGRLVDLATARATPLAVAAANWLALATFAGRFAPEGPALLIDIGSTTTDIIPLLDGRPIPRGRTDPERLKSRELIYSGVRRTPLCALLGAGGAAEWFATTLDVYLVLKETLEDPADHGTADGRPATVPMAHARLARMRCADGETCSEADTRQLACAIRSRQVGLLRQGVERVSAILPGLPATIILAGSGEFLARRVLAESPCLAARVVSLAQNLGPQISQAACAYALAVLAMEHDADDP
jgi:probable H4MPT-linked C1 transfer pathway protein